MKTKVSLGVSEAIVKNNVNKKTVKRISASEQEVKDTLGYLRGKSKYRFSSYLNLTICIICHHFLFRRNNVSDAIKFLHENERLKKEIEYYSDELQVKMPFWVLFEFAVDKLKENGIPYKNEKALDRALRRYCANSDHGVTFNHCTFLLISLPPSILFCLCSEISLREGKNHNELPEKELGYRLKSNNQTLFKKLFSFH